MPTVITGTDGINQVQAGAVESGDLPAGSVIQVVHIEDQDRSTYSPETFHDVISATITPNNNSSRIIIQGHVHLGGDANNSLGIRIRRNGVLIGSKGTIATEAHSALSASNSFNWTQKMLPINFVDNPGTSSALTYTIQAQFWGNTALVINGSEGNANTFAGGSALATTQLILMEVAG